MNSKEEDIAKILRDNIYFAGQLGDYVIHGAIEKIIKYFQQEYAQQQLAPSSDKYSWGKVKDDVFIVWHTEGDIKTLIAQTDNAEKAHFLAAAANQYREPAERAAQTDVATDDDWKAKLAEAFHQRSFDDFDTREQSIALWMAENLKIK